MNRSELLGYVKSKLGEVYPETEVAAMTRELIAYWSGACNMSSWLADWQEEIEDGLQTKVEEDLVKLLDQYPLQYLIGTVEWGGMQLKVDKRALIPRPETEQLISMIIHEVGSNKDLTTMAMIDMCSGSGCLALGLKKEFASAEVQGWEYSQEALQLAKENGASLHLEVAWTEVDVLSKEAESLAEKWKGQVAVIVSNPPYIPKDKAHEIGENVWRYEPEQALIPSGDDALVFYRSITALSEAMLCTGGRLYFECYAELSTEVLELLNRDRWSTTTIVEDLYGKPRFVAGTKK